MISRNKMKDIGIESILLNLESALLRIGSSKYLFPTLLILQIFREGYKSFYPENGSLLLYSLYVVIILGYGILLLCSGENKGRAIIASGLLMWEYFKWMFFLFDDKYVEIYLLLFLEIPAFFVAIIIFLKIKPKISISSLIPIGFCYLGFQLFNIQTNWEFFRQLKFGHNHFLASSQLSFIFITLAFLAKKKYGLNLVRSYAPFIGISTLFSKGFRLFNVDKYPIIVFLFWVTSLLVFFVIIPQIKFLDNNVWANFAVILLTAIVLLGLSTIKWKFFLGYDQMGTLHWPKRNIIFMESILLWYPLVFLSLNSTGNVAQDDKLA